MRTRRVKTINKNTFVPVTFEITFETQKEADFMLALFNDAEVLGKVIVDSEMVISVPLYDATAFAEKLFGYEDFFLVAPKVQNLVNSHPVKLG